MINWLEHMFQLYYKNLSDMKKAAEMYSDSDWGKGGSGALLCQESF